MKKTIMISTLVIAFTIGITNVLASEYTKFSSTFIKNLKIAIITKKLQIQNLKEMHFQQTEKL